MPTLLSDPRPPIIWWDFWAAAGTQIKNTHSEVLSVASVLQFIVACVKSECLHDIGASPQELPVQLPHWNNKLVWHILTDTKLLNITK